MKRDEVEERFGKPGEVDRFDLEGPDGEHVTIERKVERGMSTVASWIFDPAKFTHRISDADAVTTPFREIDPRIRKALDGCEDFE